MYTSEEYCDMLLLYGKFDMNANAAAREYAIKYPNRNHPDKNVILQLVNRARTTGNLNRPKPLGAPRYVRNQNEEAVLNAFVADSTRSIRTVANIVGVSRSTTQRIMKDNRKHPFHYTRVQHLLPEDYPVRRRFCRWVLEQHEANPNFVQQIIFTDESCFGRRGVFNSRNFHVWADENENPHAIFQNSFQHRFSVNLWAGILGNNVVGPHEFPPALNGETYAEFLEQNLPALLQNLPDRNFANAQWFQHDGAPPHFSRHARRVLDDSFPNSWIGRGGPVHWPPRSPDLNPLDYFFWGHLKNLVYREEIHTEAQLRQRMQDALNTITPEMLLRCGESLIRRAHLCIEMNGGHFEQLL